MTTDAKKLPGRVMYARKDHYPHSFFQVCSLPFGILGPEDENQLEVILMTPAELAAFVLEEKTAAWNAACMSRAGVKDCSFEEWEAKR